MNIKMSKRQMKRHLRYKEAEKPADEILKDFGKALGESRAAWVESIIEEEKLNK